MSGDFNLNAQVRKDVGKGASRRLRNTGMVPAVLYGGEQEPMSLLVAHKDLTKQLENEAFYSHILTLNIDGKAQQAVLKDLQRHPARPIVMHADFQRIDATHKIHMHVPLHFKGEDVAPGVKAGGVITHTATNVEVVCLPKDLPEYIEVDISKLDMGHAVHLSDLKIPAGVQLVALSHGPEHDLPVVSIHASRAAKESDEGSAPAGGAEGEKPAE